MKTISTLCILAITASLAACNSNQHQSSTADDSAEATMVTSQEEEEASPSSSSWHVDGNTMTYGSHTYTMSGNISQEYQAGATAQVTFTHVPADVQEFTTVYEQLLGKSSYGVCALMPMAFELWGRNHSMGEQCLRMVCTETCYSEVMRELPRHMEASSHSAASDPYVQRCLPAAMLAGATKENGYNPIQPYTVNIKIGRGDTWGQESELMQGNVYGLDIVTENAWNTPLRPVSVMLPWRGQQLYKVSTCASLYFNIYSPRQDWNGLQ